MLLIGQMIGLRMLMKHLIFLLPTFFYSLPASGTLPVIAFLWTDSGTQSDQALAFWLKDQSGDCSLQDCSAATAHIRFVGTLTINTVVSNG